MIRQRPANLRFKGSPVSGKSRSLCHFRSCRAECSRSGGSAWPHQLEQERISVSDVLVDSGNLASDLCAPIRGLVAFRALLYRLSAVSGKVRALVFHRKFRLLFASTYAAERLSYLVDVACCQVTGSLSGSLVSAQCAPCERKVPVINKWSLRQTAKFSAVCITHSLCALVQRLHRCVWLTAVHCAAGTLHNCAVLLISQ